jgi:hypothetical protein
MPPCGTFNYFAVVPPESEGRSAKWRVQLTEPVEQTGQESTDSRLVGLSPLLEIADGGSTPNPSATRPAVLRSRFTLTASEERHSQLSAASFYIDRDLTSIFEPGDRLYMARTASAGLGVSLLRNDRLVFGVGAISSVPLGSGIQGSVPHDLVRKASACFKTRDKNFTFSELPIQITVDNEVRIASRGWHQLGNYAIWVNHGYYPGIPGKDVSVAIALKGACGSVPATASAQLLDAGELEMVRW